MLPQINFSMPKSMLIQFVGVFYDLCYFSKFLFDPPIYRFYHQRIIRALRYLISNFFSLFLPLLLLQLMFIQNPRQLCLFQVLNQWHLFELFLFLFSIFLYLIFALLHELKHIILAKIISGHFKLLLIRDFSLIILTSYILSDIIFTCLIIES